MKIHRFCLYLIVISISASCNPDCSTLSNIQIDSFFKQQGQQMLIRADNLSGLSASDIQFVSSNGTTTAKSMFMADQGLIVTVPNGVSGTGVQLIINDPDCGSAVFSSNLTIGDAAFFEDNPSFIPPAPFEFVIPTPPVAFPPLVQNAWVSPQDLDYCIWFKFLPEMDANGDVIMEMVNGMQVPKESVNLDQNASSEFSVEELVCDGNNMCNGPFKNLYHCNPVRGIIDKQNNIIHFWIDRTNVDGQNLGVEEFVGQFIDINNAGYAEEKIPECSPSGLFQPIKRYLMLITSQTTGRQLLLYQQEFL